MSFEVTDEERQWYAEISHEEDPSGGDIWCPDSNGAHARCLRTGRWLFWTSTCLDPDGNEAYDPPDPEFIDSSDYPDGDFIFFGGKELFRKGNKFLTGQRNQSRAIIKIYGNFVFVRVQGQPVTFYTSKLESCFPRAIGEWNHHSSFNFSGLTWLSAVADLLAVNRLEALERLCVVRDGVAELIHPLDKFFVANGEPPLREAMVPDSMMRKSRAKLDLPKNDDVEVIVDWIFEDS